MWTEERRCVYSGKESWGLSQSERANIQRVWPFKETTVVLESWFIVEYLSTKVPSMMSEKRDATEYDAPELITIDRPLSQEER